MQSKQVKVFNFERVQKAPMRDEELWRCELERNFTADEPELPLGYRHLHEPIDVIVRFL